MLSRNQYEQGNNQGVGGRGRPSTRTFLKLDRVEGTRAREERLQSCDSTPQVVAYTLGPGLNLGLDVVKGAHRGRRRRRLGGPGVASQHGGACQRCDDKEI